ncbi:LANO_0F03686g1_1 [Lachancea nothofagi CBS 11611]|uniref:LANO_0F03686g1_1 n=1 Tax=Lachancea nothofagi CBS 11611 TaxID=1266666 RepID=A0A1G4K7B7_9SACH|nr:LANO_0F03686g1_1 [Lachancea nothofagi CBS 11611]
MDIDPRHAHYKVQLLLHINSVLLARINQMNANPSQFSLEQQQNIASQYLKRVHANLQCISQLNQGIQTSKPAVLEPPQLPLQQNSQDILAKLYLLTSRVFEVW